MITPFAVAAAVQESYPSSELADALLSLALAYAEDGRSSAARNTARQSAAVLSALSAAQWGSYLPDSYPYDHALLSGTKEGPPRLFGQSTDAFTRPWVIDFPNDRARLALELATDSARDCKFPPVH